MVATLHIRLLGQFSLSEDDRPITGLNAARLQSMLAYLVFHRAAPLSREHLAFLFWPDSSEGQALNNLRKALHHLRHHLPDADRFVRADAKTVQWLPDAPFTLDVAGFEHALDAARRSRAADDAAAPRSHLADAARLYLGDLLPGCYEDWIAPERERLREAFLAALAELAELLEAAGQVAAAIQHTQHLLRHDPLNEPAYRHLMRLHASNADPGAALRVYHTCASTLQRELGVAPSPLTQQHYAQLLGHDTAAMPATMPATMPEAMSAAAPSFIARKAEWSTLQTTWRLAAGGRPQCVLIAGEAGAGKTRLIEEFLAWASHHDVARAYTRSYAAEGPLAYAPVADWLRNREFKPRWGALEPAWLCELARVLPELLIERPDLPAPRPITEAWQRKQLFEALARAMIACGRPLLLALDDAQWCDRDTLEWLHFLLRYDASLPLLIVLGFRTGEVLLDAAPEHPLSTLLLDLQSRQQITEVELAALSPAETSELAAQIVDKQLSRAAHEQLYRDSQGNPLFIIEMARAVALHLGGEAAAVAAAPALPLPAKVQAVLRARLAQLSPPARAIANVAAIIGREFTGEVASLACAADVSPDAFMRGLDELWQRRIIREHGADAYDFSHDRIRDVAVASLGPARRRSLHRRVADALVRAYGSNLDPVSARLAAHLDAAGAHREAVPHYLRASQVAHALISYEDEAAFLQKGLDALTKSPPSTARDDHRLAFLLARAFALLPSRGAADEELTDLYRQALPLCKSPGHEAQLYQANRGLWLHHLWQGQAAPAGRFASQNLSLVEATDDRVRIGEAERCFAMAEWMRGNLAPACQHIERAILMNPPHEMLRQSDVMDLWHGTDHVNTSAIMLWLSGYPDRALARSEEGMAFNRALQQPFAVVCALEFHAVVHYLLRRPADGASVADELIELSEKFGFPQNVDIGHMHQGWPLAASGCGAKGIVQLQRGIDGCIRSRMLMMLTLYWDMLARMQLTAGRPEDARASLGEALALADRNDERFWLAELHRTQGDLAWVEGMADSATACYRRALAVARQQGARSLELRAAISLAQVPQDDASRTGAIDVLRSIYGWFTEGFETADLVTARDLLHGRRAR